MNVQWWLGAILAIGFLRTLEGQTLQLRRGAIGSICTFDTAAVTATALYTLFLVSRNPAEPRLRRY